MGLTMSEKVQAARDRALLISQQDADAPRLTDRLDAQSLAVLVEAFDATRAKLAEVEARCAEVERERDEARKECEAWETGGRMAPLTIARVALEAQQTTERALAAWQAECARLREAGSALAHWATPLGSIDAMIQAEQLRLARVQWAALASAPGSTDALRAMLKEAATEGINEGYGNGLSYGTERIEAIVSRILGERSDDAPQWRGERGKEGGDE